MNKKLLYGFLLVCTLILCVSVIFCLPVERTQDVPFFLTIRDDNADLIVKPYFAEDGSCHFFLPAHCSRTQITFRKAGQGASDEAILKDGDDLSGVEPEKAYRIKTDGVEYDLHFWQADDVPTLYLNTRSGNMEHIHADKKNREAASIRLYKQDGTLDYANDVCTVKGRGNATWNCRKKPYNLILQTAAELLGMDSGTQWILLANAFDRSGLFNVLAFDLAEKTELGWTPEHAYVEVYLNGEYNGLYLLTQKIDTSQEQLQLQTKQGDFLACVEPNMRKAVLDDPILTRSDRVIDLCIPQEPTRQQRTRIEEMTQQFEQAVLSAPDGPWPQLLDMESFAKRYLIDEICANIDADLASSFFCYRDGVFYAGPVWDFDMAFGNQICNENPSGFVAANEWRSKTFRTPYDTALLQNETFSQYVKQLYESRFLPVIEQWLEEDILQMAQNLSVCTRRNSIRWEEMFEKNPFTATSAEEIISYLEERTAFLSKAWIEETQMCTLQFEILPGSSYWNIGVEYGTYLSKDFLTLHEQFRYLELDDVDEEAVWIVRNTGEEFRFDEPVTQDLILVQKDPPVQEQTVQETQPEDRTELRISLACCCLLAAGFAVLLVVDISRNRKGRRKYP